MAKTRLPKANPVRQKVEAKGGPWRGALLLLPVDGSMVFRVGNYRGHYDSQGYWQEIWF